MILSIKDFPIRIEGEYIRNCKGDIILDLKSPKKVLSQFICENISAINDGKRVYKRRLTRTFFNQSLEKAEKILIEEMFKKGYVETTKGEIEYTIICENEDIEKRKLIFTKMEENKKEIGQHLDTLLTQLLDAKTKENLTEENKDVAMTDLIKLLNLYYNNIISNKEQELKGLFNKHQDIWYSAIISANKKVKYPLLSITSGLWRCYIITIFASKGEDKLLKELTGWSGKMLEKEKFTYDMKMILLSVNNIFQRKEEQENK